MANMDFDKAFTERIAKRFSLDLEYVKEQLAKIRAIERRQKIIRVEGSAPNPNGQIDIKGVFRVANTLFRLAPNSFVPNSFETALELVLDRVSKGHDLDLIETQGRNQVERLARCQAEHKSEPPKKPFKPRIL